jgi:bacterial/archaeal transporter family-2 protein
MNYWIYGLPILAGVAMATQAGVNGQLRQAVGNPFTTAFLSFLVGTLSSGLVLLLSRQPFPGWQQLRSSPPYYYSGGLLGAFFVTAIILSVQRVGAATLFALLVFGQLLTALLYDHFGLLGLRENPLTGRALLGVLLLVTGVYLIYRR